jgi:mono/diheme cytochrome c family protein
MKRVKRYSIGLSALVLLSATLSSCGSDPQSPGLEYMPDMYRSPAMEPYTKNDKPVDGANFEDNMQAMQPPAGAIARGYLPYGIPNSVEGYEMAGSLLSNPYPMTEAILAEGKVIYTKFCWHCHGDKGMGDGPTVTAGGHPPPPAYNSAALKDLPEGKMFHTITYGKNLMGSHSSQLNIEERWKVIRYVQAMQGPKEEAPAADGQAQETAQSDATETAMNNPQ